MECQSLYIVVLDQNQKPEKSTDLTISIPLFMVLCFDPSIVHFSFLAAMQGCFSKNACNYAFMFCELSCFSFCLILTLVGEKRCRYINCCIGHDSAPAHHSRQKIELLQRKTPKFIPPDFRPLNSHDLSLVDCRIWAWCKIVYIRHQFEAWPMGQRLIDTSNSLLQSTVDDAVDE